MQELYDTAVEMSRKTEFPIDQCMIIIVARQQNKLLEKQIQLLEIIAGKKEQPEIIDIMRYIN